MSFIFVTRHGERADWADKQKLHDANFIPPYPKFDPFLSARGKQQAKELGQHLAPLLLQQNISISKILVSPFIRTIQTAFQIYNQIKPICKNIQLCIEYGVGEWHSNWNPQKLPQWDPLKVIQYEIENELKTSVESYCQQMQLQSIEQIFNPNYKSLLSKNYFDKMAEENVGEPVSELQNRCQQVADGIVKRLENTNENILLVTHAATVLAMVRAFLRDHTHPVRTGVCSLNTLQLDHSQLPYTTNLHTYHTEYLSGGEENHWNFPNEDHLYSHLTIPNKQPF